MLLNGSPGVYQETAFDKHQYIWNIIAHNLKVNVSSADDMHKKLKKIFPDYDDEMWKFMHDYDLNANFCTKDHGFRLLEYAKTIRKNENDAMVSIASLLKACKLCRWMLGKFHTLCENGKPEAYNAGVLKFAATELEFCIKGLESSDKEIYKCDDLKFRYKEEVCEFDKVILASLRCICFGLSVWQHVIYEKPTGETITEAVKLTNLEFKEFYNVNLTVEQLTHLCTPENGWPKIYTVCKILGKNLARVFNDRASRAEEIRELRLDLIKVLGD